MKKNQDNLGLNLDLYTACEVGDHHLAQTLTEHGADISSKYSNQLVIAAKNGHTASVKLLLKRGAEVNGVDEHGDSALLVAFQNRHYDAVQLLLDYGARVTASICSPLQFQLEGGYLSIHTGMVTKLADQMLARSNFPIPFASLALYAFKHGLRDLSLQFLSVKRSDTAIICNSFALYYSAKYDWFDIVKHLLENNVNVDTVWHSKTAVYGACKHHSYRALEVLLEYNPNPYLHNLYNDLRRHLIFVACQKNNKKIVKMLLDRGCFRSSSVDHTYSVLHIAYDSGNWDIVQMMLSMRFHVDDPDSLGMTLLHKAVHSCNRDQVHELLEMRANVNRVNHKGESPLHLACVCEESAGNVDRNTRSALVELLVVNGAASCNVMCQRGETPLYRACANHFEVAVNILLEAGADCNLTSSHRYPILAACHSGNKAVLNLLLQRRDIHLNVLGLLETDSSNVVLSTPLCVAVQKGHADAVKLLLIHNADVNFTDESGASPLDHVIRKIANTADASQNANLLEILQLLLSYKADVNHFVDGFSPLQRASLAGLETVVSLLLQNGANPFQSNSLGECALGYACHSNRIHLIQLFLKNLGKLWEVRDEFSHRIFASKLPSPSVTTEYGTDDVTRILLEYGFKCRISSPTGNSIQLPQDQRKVAEWLLKLITIGANNVWVDNNDECPLYTACCSGTKSSATTCRQEGKAHQNFPSTKTPLYATRLRKTLPLIRLFIEININPKLPSSNQTEPSTCRKRKLSTTDEGLCQSKRQCRTSDNVNDKQDAGSCEQVTAQRDRSSQSLSSLLCLMCRWGWTSVTAMLLELGADADFVAIDGDTPLQCAVEFVIQYASSHNCLGNCQTRHSIAREDVVTADVDLQTASVGTVEKLIKHGANVNCHDAKGKTPLHRLVEAICGNVTCKPLWLVLDILLNNGANVNALSEDHESPLYTASAAGNASVLSKLAKYINAAGFKAAGKNPFLVPCWKGNLDIVNLLLRCGIDPNLNRSLHGKSDGSLEAVESDSPLCMAIRGGHIEIANLLLRNGADPSGVDFDGSTSLLLASDKFSEQPNDETIRTSMYHPINYGSCMADVKMFDEESHTSLLMAEMYRMVDNNQNLPSHNADQNWTSAFARTLMDVEQTIALIQGGASVDLARSDDNQWREEQTVSNALVIC